MKLKTLLIIVALFAFVLPQLSSATEQAAPSGTMTVASLSQTAQITRAPSVRKGETKLICVQPPSVCGANSDCSCSRCCSSWRVCQPTC